VPELAHATKVLGAEVLAIEMLMVNNLGVKSMVEKNLGSTG
jgi:hypothetical protein